jgi:hypothetical protein
MPGKPSDSRKMSIVGAAFGLVAVVGYLVLDWQFGGETGGVPLALAVAAVALAVGVTLYRRLGTGD